jgi:hypothetical protein
VDSVASRSLDRLQTCTTESDIPSGALEVAEY